MAAIEKRKKEKVTEMKVKITPYNTIKADQISRAFCLFISFQVIFTFISVTFSFFLFSIAAIVSS